jgi:hypothetical protein
LKTLKPIEHEKCCLFGAKGGVCVSVVCVCCVCVSVVFVSVADHRMFTVYVNRLTFVIMVQVCFLWCSN